MEIAELERFIRINRNELDEELIRQPELTYHAAKGYAIAISKKDYAKDQCKQVEAKVDERIRAASAGEKVTVKEIEARVAKSKLVVDANKKLRLANKKVAEWEAIKSAIHARGFALRELTELLKMEYFTPSTDARAADAREQLKEERRRIAGKRGKRSKLK
jgi:hypothetical protein